jgi:hypothetical protein
MIFLGSAPIPPEIYPFSPTRTFIAFMAAYLSLVAAIRFVSVGWGPC